LALDPRKDDGDGVDVVPFVVTKGNALRLSAMRAQVLRLYNQF